MTSLTVGRRGNCGSIHVGRNAFLFSANRPDRGCFLLRGGGGGGGGVKRLERVEGPSVLLGLKMSGAISVLPPFAFMARTGKALPLPRFTHALRNSESVTLFRLLMK